MISKSSENLIRGLCTESETRLGSQNGARDIKCHPFFNGIDFTKPLRDQQAPWRPEILYETDTSNFDPIDPDRLMTSEDDSEEEDGHKSKKHSKDYHGFYDFTFRRFFDDGGHPLRTGHRVYNTEDGAASNSATGAAGATGGADGPIPAPDPVYV